MRLSAGRLQPRHLVLCCPDRVDIAASKQRPAKASNVESRRDIRFATRCANVPESKFDGCGRDPMARTSTLRMDPRDARHRISSKAIGSEFASVRDAKSEPTIAPRSGCFRICIEARTCRCATRAAFPDTPFGDTTMSAKVHLKI